MSMTNWNGRAVVGTTSLLLFLFIFSGVVKAEITLVDVSCDAYNVDPKEVVPVTATYRNAGDVREKIYVEACIYPPDVGFSLLPLSITPHTCCPGNYFCDGGWLELEPGEEHSVMFYPKAPGPDAVDNCGSQNFWRGEGYYIVKMVSTDSCCVGPDANPNCQAKPPHYWGTIVTGINVGNAGGEPYWLIWLKENWYILAAIFLIGGGIALALKK